MSQIIFTHKEAACRLRISTDLLKSMRENGLIDAIRIGHGKKRPQYRYSEYAIRRFISANEGGAMSVFKRNDTGKYKYEFARHGRKFSKSGFTSRNQAQKAEESHKQSLTGWKPGILFRDAVDQYWLQKGAHHSNSSNEKVYSGNAKGPPGRHRSKSYRDSRYQPIDCLWLPKMDWHQRQSIEPLPS